MLRNISEFKIPKYRTSTREKCLKIRGPKIWNNIPVEIRDLPAVLRMLYGVNFLTSSAPVEYLIIHDHLIIFMIVRILYCQHFSFYSFFYK